MPTPICRITPIPYRAGRMALGIGLEASYGYEQPVLNELAYYGDANPLATSFNIVESQQAINTWQESTVSGGISVLTGQTYVYETADLPFWFDLLQIGGLSQTSDYRFIASREKSATITVAYQDLLHVLTGARCSWGFSAQTGQPMFLSFSTQGKYNTRRLETITLNRQTINPIKTFKDVSFRLTVDGVDYNIPLLSFTLTNNRTLQARYEAWLRGEISEIFLSYPIDVTWEILLELNKNINWVEILRSNKYAQLELQFGRIKFSAPKAKIRATPGDGSSNGIRTQLIQFRLEGPDYLEIQYI